ncbi:MAG: alpha/beta hydrolase [Erythrobacter sp.]
METPYTDRFWTSQDGLKLHFRDYAGPSDSLPVICLHGLTRNSRDFAGLAEQLSSRNRVLVPEVRGRGMSEYAKDWQTYSPLQYVADLKALLEQEGIERFIAIGTSMGGLMTMILSAMQPGVVAGAVINDVGPEIDPAGIARINTYVGHNRSFPTWLHAARALQESGSSSFPDYDINRWIEMAKRAMVVGQNGRIGFDYDMAIAEPFKQPGNAAPPDLWPMFDSLKDAPLLVLRGELSDLFSPETLAKMHARHPDMQSIIIPRVGHAPMLDEPESVAGIEAFLARVG